MVKVDTSGGGAVGLLPAAAAMPRFAARVVTYS